jgi:hypothetical protein
MLAASSKKCDDGSKFAESVTLMTRMIGLAFALCLFPVTVSRLAAQPRAKETTTKPPAVAELKPDAAASSPAVSVPAGPAICVTANDVDPSKPAVAGDKASTLASAQTSNDSEAVAESGSDSSAEFMKDKLKLSLGGKPGLAADQPQQCGIAEAGAQD